MKVLMFGWEFPPKISGGLGIASEGLVRGLVAAGAKVAFVVPKQFGEPNGHDYDLVDASEVVVHTEKIIGETFWEKINYTRIASRLIPYIDQEDYLILAEKEKGKTLQTEVLKEKFDFTGGYGETLMLEIARFGMVAAQMAEEDRFDVVHCHDWMTWTAGMAVTAETGTPMVAHVHSTEIERSMPWINQEIYEMEKTGLRYASAVIAVSNRTKQILIKHYGLSEHKIKVVHNAYADTFKLENPRDMGKSAPRITFLGRFARQKGPLLFVDVAWTLKLKIPNAQFTMAGDGYQLEEIKNKVAENRLEDDFTFPGFLDHDEVKTLLDQTDVLVMPSVSEPFGMVAIEAVQMGVPIIITNQTGAGEVLPNAYSFDYWDTYEMANQIEYLLQNPKEAVANTKINQQDVGKLSWEKAAKEVMELYEELTLNASGNR